MVVVDSFPQGYIAFGLPAIHCDNGYFIWIQFNIKSKNKVLATKFEKQFLGKFRIGHSKAAQYDFINPAREKLINIFTCSNSPPKLNGQMSSLSELKDDGNLLTSFIFSPRQIYNMHNTSP